MSPGERDDELFERYLEGDSELSRAYRRHAGEQPDAALDARILAEAHRAVAPERRVAHSPFARNWMVPTSLAAVLVLSLSVVLLMPDPALEPGLDYGSPGEPATLRSAPEAKRENVPGRLEKDADTREDAAGEAVGGALRELAPSAAEPSEIADEAVAKPAEKRKAPPSGQPGTGSDALRSQPAAPAARLADEAEEAKAPAAVTPRSRDATGKARQDASGAAPDAQPMPSDDLRADPAAWLAFIEGLVEAHDIDGAKSNLRAFRRQYPDYPLPRSLAPLAASLDMQSE